MIWRELWTESDGSVMSYYEVVEEHSKGRDLKANKDAGMAIGWSTYGYGSAHEPGDEERAEYGLEPDEWAVVMDRNYRLKDRRASTTRASPTRGTAATSARRRSRAGGTPGRV